MTVDFAMKRSPKFRVASLPRNGPWKEDNLRSEFAELTRWAKAQGLRTGRWVFLEHSHTRWEACLEIGTRAAAPSGAIRIKTLPAATVAYVVFDPDEIEPRVIYHGLADYLRHRRKDGKVGPVLAVREVYAGDPWTNAKASARTEVQFVLRPR